MDQSKGRLALAEAMQLHREHVSSAHKRVHAAQRELASATQSMQLAVKAQEAFVAAIRVIASCAMTGATSDWTVSRR